MAHIGLLSVMLLGLVVLTVANDAVDHSGKSRRARSASDVWHKFTRTLQERTFTCKEMHDECHGSIFDRCCGDLICYREMDLEIHDLFDEGYCVECLDRSQVCQKDKHCCANLACIKEKIYSINGLCEPKLGYKGHCHHDSDCQSGDCRREHFWSLHGSCTAA